jgi:hypothetical protein
VDGHDRVAVLALGPHVGGLPGEEALRPLTVRKIRGLAHGITLGPGQLLEKGGPAIVVGENRALLRDELAERLDAELRHQELDARPTAIALLAQAREHAGHGLDLGEELLFGCELGEHLGLVGHRAETAAHHHLEAASTVLHARDEAGVVELHQSAGLLLAARERGLELAPEVLDVRVAEQELHQRPGVGRHVEGLGPADARHGAAGHVSDRIAAGLPGRDADGGQAPHQVRRVLDVDVVELDVLTRGDVQDAVRVLLGERRELVELVGRDAAEGDLDAHHPGRVPDRLRALGGLLFEGERALGDSVVATAVVVALAVDAPPQARLGEHLVLDPALASQLDLALEQIDLVRPGGDHAVLQGFLPCGVGHGGRSSGREAATGGRPSGRGWTRESTLRPDLCKQYPITDIGIQMPEILGGYGV